MTKLTFEPFDKEQLIKDLKAYFPQYSIKKGIGNIQVRKRVFTLTGVVGLNIQANKGKITTQTNYDLRFLYLMFGGVMGLYIFSKKKAQREMEQEVVTALKSLLKPVNTSL